MNNLVNDLCGGDLEDLDDIVGGFAGYSVSDVPLTDGGGHNNNNSSHHHRHHQHHHNNQRNNSDHGNEQLIDTATNATKNKDGSSSTDGGPAAVAALRNSESLMQQQRRNSSNERHNNNSHNRHGHHQNHHRHHRRTTGGGGGVNDDDANSNGSGDEQQQQQRVHHIALPPHHQEGHRLHSPPRRTANNNTASVVGGSGSRNILRFGGGGGSSRKQTPGTATVSTSGTEILIADSAGATRLSRENLLRHTTQQQHDINNNNSRKTGDDDDEFAVPVGQDNVNNNNENDSARATPARTADNVSVISGATSTARGDGGAGTLQATSRSTSVTTGRNFLSFGAKRNPQQQNSSNNNNSAAAVAVTSSGGNNNNVNMNQSSSAAISASNLTTPTTAAAIGAKLHFPTFARNGGNNNNNKDQQQLVNNRTAVNAGGEDSAAAPPTPRRSISAAGVSDNGTTTGFASSSLARGLGSVVVGPPSSGAPVMMMSFEADAPTLSLPDFYALQRTLENSYRLETKISEGTYGEVFHGTDLVAERQQQQQQQDQQQPLASSQRDKRVAIKKLKFLQQLDGFPLTSVREITVLKHLASLPPERRRYFSVTRDIVMGSTFRDTYLVFDLVQHSLHGLLMNRTAAWSFGAWQFLVLEVCRAVRILHDVGIMHRDIKTNNILVGSDGAVKLCDFGLAVSDNLRQRLTPSLIALDFRPPEMLLGMENYDDRVDVWSVGCLLVHVFIGFPPFFQVNHRPRAGQHQQQQQQLTKAQSELEQLALIAQRLNIPVNAMMSAETASRCKRLRDVLQQMDIRNPQAIRRDSNAVAAAGAGAGAVLLPGRCSPRNDFFERFLRTQYELHQTRMQQKLMQRQQQQQQPNQQATRLAPPQQIDAALLDAIVWMLQPDPGQRPRMRQVLEHPFFINAQRDERYSLASLRQLLAGLGDARLH